jgi:hypothetical protein
LFLDGGAPAIGTHPDTGIGIPKRLILPEMDKEAGAVGQEWLDDFLVHLGQNESLRNPNAGIRVRPNGGGAAV